ncbi:MAG: DNA polymerase III subunit delta' [Syntrophomonadaceae bacterium]|nr:DNA polymerase III subunit delta' [Syntrophomonadaceae bacterium]
MDYFDGIVGQDRALQILRRALATGAINHAYLFTGPAGVGKRTAAWAFARAIVLGHDPEGEIYFREKVHPDFMLIEKPENKTSIAIEQINREMEPWLAMKPYRAARRVVIIHEAHLMSMPAANALLKTLEEPPGYAVIILVTAEPNLMETIVSRCQLIRFSPATESDIRQILIKRGLEDDDRLTNLARLGQGSIAAAIQLAEEEGIEELWHTTRNMVKDLSAGGDVEVFKCAELMEKKPAMIAGMLAALLRDIYIFQTTGRRALLVVESNHDFYKEFKPLDPERVMTTLSQMDKLSRQYRGPVNSLLLSINISYQLRDALK